jgi:glycine oxidase
VPDRPSPSVSSAGHDLVIAGGGVIGMSIAFAAAKRGMRPVVCDPSPGRGATWAAAGMLAPVTEAHIGDDDLVRLHLAAAARWAGFATELESCAGAGVGYLPCGTIVVALDQSDMDLIERILSFHESLGLVSARLTASECRSLLPVLLPAIRGGAIAPSDHQVDNRLLAGALERGLRALGVEIVLESVTEVLVSNNRGRESATGVRLSDGREIAAPTVVVATGCWTPNLGGMPSGVIPPVRPVKGHVLRLKGPASRPLIDRNLRCIVHGSAIYVVPRADGTIVIGATVEEMGYDTTVQAGAVYELLRDARSILPGIAELELAECSVGLRPGSPDNGPFVGWTRVDGLCVATGHYRNGILLAPVTADAVCDVLEGKPLPDFMLPFRADRPFRSLTPR